MPYINKKTSHMNNPVTIIELPVSDLQRAIAFYQAILGITIEEAAMGDTRMGVLPADEGAVSVVLVHGEGYVPTADGAVVYLNAGDSVQAIQDRIEANGGQVIVPRTEISAEMGYFALFIDTEGNRIGLHAAR